jgi:hypothetical protein
MPSHAIARRPPNNFQNILKAEAFLGAAPLPVKEPLAAGWMAHQTPGAPMKPGEHPDFFRFPAPEGRSRESTLRLDAQGRFWHDGARVEHAGLAAALHGWIARHPDDGRYILTNGYDWTYFTVDDAPFSVRSLRIEPERVALLLSDGTEEAWEPESTWVGDDGALRTRVKPGALGGPFEAKFCPHAQSSLAPLLLEVDESAPAREREREREEAGANVAVRIGGRLHAIGAKKPRFG